MSLGDWIDDHYFEISVVLSLIVIIGGFLGMFYIISESNSERAEKFGFDECDGLACWNETQVCEIVGIGGYQTVGHCFTIYAHNRERK